LVRLGELLLVHVLRVLLIGLERIHGGGVIEEFECVFAAREHVGGWHAEKLNETHQHAVLIDAREEGQTHEEFEANAAERPHVDG
jgi:hypothetical protein